MQNLSLLPINPGCYIFKDKTGKIIYIGKAKNLKKRVSNYFQKKDHDPKTKALVAQINDIDFIITNTEVEALILENNLIKKNQPKYNIDLKDSKSYSFILKTEEEFPRLLIARDKNLKGKYYGPFTSAKDRDLLLKLVRRFFKLRTCKKMPKKPCLRYHIKLCEAPCIELISKEEYQNNIQKAEKLMLGKTDQLINDLKLEMKTESTNQNFEKALMIRDQIHSLSFVHEKQSMERQKEYDEDIINYIVHENMVYLILFNIYKGMLINKQDFKFNYQENFIEEFIVQYYSENKIPKEIILPKKIDDALIEFLNNLASKKVTVKIPSQGEKKNLLELVKKNIEITFFGDQTKLIHLQNKLKLNELPHVIECFDISHLSGTATVGSMVQFRNAKPDKANYRRFKIRTVEGIDDFSSIAEVVSRRYKRLKEENQEMPDLIIIDGGKGQLTAAITQLQKLNLQIPIISIAKKFEEIYFPGSKFPLKLPKTEKALLYIQEIRDEAHRFAIAYNRLLRKKKIRGK